MQLWHAVGYLIWVVVRDAILDVCFFSRWGANHDRQEADRAVGRYFCRGQRLLLAGNFILLLRVTCTECLTEQLLSLVLIGSVVDQLLHAYW